MTLASGTKLGRYEIRSKLGEGGMGEVYLAEDNELHRKVALKVLPADVVTNNDRMRRFKQEATAAAALNHPNIAHFLFLGRNAQPENRAIYVGTLDSKETTPLLQVHSSIAYAPPGYLLFVRENTLMAQGFDADTYCSLSPSVHLIGFSTF
jgi:serine/threonine protein kinase